MFAYGAGAVPRRSTWSPARATSTSPPPSGCSRARRHRRRGRPDRDRDPRRRHRRPGARRRRPDQPGRARPAGRRRAGHRRRASWPTRSTPSSSEQVAGDQARRADPHRADRPAVRRSCWSTTSTQGLAVVDAYAAEHLEIQTARRRRRGRAGSATPARSSSAPCSPVSLGDYCAGSNHVLPTGGCACHSSGLSVQSFLRGVHVVEYSERRAGARSPTTCVDARRRRGPARARRGRHGAVRAEGRRRARERRWIDDLPLRDDLRGTHPVRRAAARRRRCGSTPTRTPTRRPAALVGGPRRARSREAAARRSTATPTATRSALRDATSRLPRTPAARGRPRATCGRPTAPTRSCSSCCRPSAGRAAPRSASRRRTRCTRLSPRGTGTEWVPGPRAPTSPSTSTRAARAGRASTRPDVVFLTVAEQPDRHGAAARRRSARLRRRPRPASWSSTRRTPSSAAPARRARSTLLPRTAAGWSSPARCARRSRFAGGRLGYLAAAPGGRRRAAARPAAVPPVGAHPGGRAGGAAARRRAARHRSTRCGPSATGSSTGCAAAGSTVVPTATPTSCCSARSPTRHAVWQALLDRGVLVRDVGIAGLAAGHGRHARGDRRVPAGGARTC